MLQPVWIVAITAICRPSGGLRIGTPPWFWAKSAEQGGWVECTGTYLHIIWLLDYAALSCPIRTQFKNDVLKIHQISSCLAMMIWD